MTRRLPQDVDASAGLAPAWQDGAALAGRLLVGGVLLYAGFMKAVAPVAEFAANIDAYRAFPHFAVMPLATVIPWLELWLGTFLVAGFEARRSAICASVFFTAFVALLASAILRGIDLATCGCFGSEWLTPRQTISMDVVLLVVSVGLALAHRQTRRWTLDRWLDQRR